MFGTAPSNGRMTMSKSELILLAVALSMDAFAVSVVKGLEAGRKNFTLAVKLALAFGFFQGFMPLVGYFLGIQFLPIIAPIDHWVAFVILGALGIHMALEKDEENAEPKPVTWTEIGTLAIATSIDALAVGITLSTITGDIVRAVIVIGCTTAVISFLGVKLGYVFGQTLGRKARVFGGTLLVLIGLKILLEHLGVFVLA